MPRKKPDTIQEVDTLPTPMPGEGDVSRVEPILKYSPEDMEKLDQFAIGLLRDGTASYDPNDVAFVNRVKQAYLRAEVMLTVRKEIAALEA